MTPAELRALLAKATPGPWEEKLEDESGHWEVRRVDGGCIAYDLGPINAALIVAAVNALPALLDVADELMNTRAMIVALMREKEIEPRTMEVIGARMVGDIDAALAKLGSKLPVIACCLLITRG